MLEMHVSFPSMTQQLLAGKIGLVFGVANERSIAWAIARAWAAAGARLIFNYQGERLKENPGPATERARFQVVPSQTVATYITEADQRWLRTPGRRGQQHVDSVMRKFRDPDNDYLDRWDLLGL